MTTLKSNLDIDVFEPDSYLDGAPYADLARLRAEAPVYRHPDPQVPEGHWAVTRHADVVHVSRHPEIFSSFERLALPTEHDDFGVSVQRLMMLNIDPPDHTRLRRLVNRGFTPRTVGRLTDRVVAACEQIVDAAVAQGTGDFVTMVSAELPLIMIAELMGVPVEERARLFEWSNRMVGSDDPTFDGIDDAQAAAMEMMAFAHEVGADKRANPVDDIVTKLVSADEDGHMLTEDEFDAFFIMLSVAGNETTRNSMTGGILALIENPDQWARLKADPSLAGTAAEEVVRWATPVKVFRRTAVQDVELGGQLIKAGDKVILHYTSANRDETVFDAPEKFDVGRDPNPHVGYGGGGPHFCLGRHLARLQIETMLRTLVDRVERIELAAPPVRLRSYLLNGFVELPVRLVPARLS